jgi:hypothetical protein
VQRSVASWREVEALPLLDLRLSPAGTMTRGRDWIKSNTEMKAKDTGVADVVTGQ